LNDLSPLAFLRFIKLPPWVKVILTGRPQAEAPLAAWTPDWIVPTAEHNQADMKMVLEARLQQGSYVAAQDMDSAVQVMLKKSQVLYYASFCAELFLGLISVQVIKCILPGTAAQP